MNHPKPRNGLFRRDTTPVSRHLATPPFTAKTSFKRKKKLIEFILNFDTLKPMISCKKLAGRRNLDTKYTTNPEFMREKP